MRLDNILDHKVPVRQEHAVSARARVGHLGWGFIPQPL